MDEDGTRSKRHRDSKEREEEGKDEDEGSDEKDRGRGSSDGEMEQAEESVFTLICLLSNLCFQSESIHSA